MSFAEPVNLLALAAVPLILSVAAMERRRRRRYAARFPGAALLAGVAGTAPRWRRRVAPLLISLAAVALALALARPERTVAVPVEKASVVLVLDGSGSMSAVDVPPSRLEVAQRAAGRFMDRVPKELLVGYVGYSSAPDVIEEPTLEHDRILLAISNLIADGATATGDALSVALDRLEARRGRDGTVAPAAIILLSDGKTTEGSDPTEAARRARQLDIPISTVALGTAEGVVSGGPFRPQIPVPPDPETLREIARISGGSAFEVEDGAQLDRIYESLGSRIGTRREQREITAGFAGAGLLLLVGGLAAGLRRRSGLA